MKDIWECTWKDCKAMAIFSQKDSDGNVWARLCPRHDDSLESAIASGSVKDIMRVWVLAGGGAEKMAKRTMEGLKK